MVDVYKPPFGTYVDVTGVVDATATGEIDVLLENLAALFGVSIDFSVSATAYTYVADSLPHPDFDKIERQQQEALAEELVAIRAAVDAAPAA